MLLELEQPRLIEIGTSSLALCGVLQSVAHGVPLIYPSEIGASLQHHASTFHYYLRQYDPH